MLGVFKRIDTLTDAKISQIASEISEQGIALRMEQDNMTHQMVRGEITIDECAERLEKLRD